MSNLKGFLYRWGLAIILMAVIFIFSSTPGSDLPNFGSVDNIVKKGGHMIGYGLLSSAYWHGLKWDKKRVWWALVFAVLYACTDEFHQSFVSGRHPSPFDVILFDAPGAAIALWIRTRFFSSTPGNFIEPTDK
jgi:VanZ family protein